MRRRRPNEPRGTWAHPARPPAYVERRSRLTSLADWNASSAQSDWIGGAAGNRARNATVAFKGRKRLNATHASTSDPDALLYRKGPGMEARLCFIGHAVMLPGLVLGIVFLQSSRQIGLYDTWTMMLLAHVVVMLDVLPQAKVLLAGRGYDVNWFQRALSARGIGPYIPLRAGRKAQIGYDKTLYRASPPTRMLDGFGEQWRLRWHILPW